MATVTTPLPDLSSEDLSLYHTTDPLLADSPILVFYGPVATANSHITSSRIQAHIFSPGGFQSFSRITVSPAAPLYVAVNHLPREKQGDEVCRGLAVSLLKYFAELSEPVKNALVKTVKTSKSSSRIPTMFDEMHAAELANRMVKVDKNMQLVRDLQDAYRERKVSWVDIDVVLPSGSINSTPQAEPQDDQSMDDDSASERYGQLNPIIKAFGEPVFLPTSKLRRAPSQSTNTSKSKTFSAQQKESLRRTMCEFVDTEERYVKKLYDLVHNVAEDFMQKSRTRSTPSTSPDEEALAQLFPPCLNQILEVNMGFLDSIRRVLEDTEQDALKDLSSDTVLITAASRRIDMTGAVSFAKALLEWLPKFAEPYAAYMRSHSNFSKVLSEFMRDNTSSFSRRVHETGEQMIRSMLMEPVQRLPRYSLLIDTMTSALPSVHPAVRRLLKARDVITDICSLESSSPQDSSKTLKRLQELVAGLPSSECPIGRIISAFDFLEIGPPYSLPRPSIHGDSGIVLLFKEALLLLNRVEGGRMTARGLLAELDKPTSGIASFPASTSTSPKPSELMFSEAITLQHLSFSHSSDARILYMAYKSSHTPPKSAMRAFVLTGSFESKAPKLSEELVKASIEGRYPESEREDGKWALLSPDTQISGLSLLAAISEEGAEDVANPRTGCSNIRVVFNKSKKERSRILNSSAVDVVASIMEIKGGHGQYRLEVDSQYGNGTVDLIPAEGIVATLAKRVSTLLHPINHLRNPQLTDSLLYSHFSILRYAATNFFGQVKASRGFRPPSPTKILSSVLSSALLKDSDNTSKKSNSLLMLKDIPKIPPPNFKTSPMKPQITMDMSFNSSKITLIADGTSEDSKDPIKSVEDTFEAYILAIGSRSGNIVARTLRARSAADELQVNELYNILLEDPACIQAAAEVSVDVLFAAFEKFLRKAWKDQIGSVVRPQALTAAQKALDSRFPEEFQNIFKLYLGEMAPQNRRALTAMIKLLAQLLDASGNDGDRGALTATFAEFLAEEGPPLEYISLLDRLIDDFDRLFDDSLPIDSNAMGGNVQGSMSSKSATTGSVGSNTSSFRKRFGFGLSRENSKLESESKVGSIIRSLSKQKISGDSESAPSSFSKATSLLRSKSIDTDPRLNSLSRPGSRDHRAGLPGSFSSEDVVTSRPNSAHNNAPTLNSIGEKPAEERNFTPRKKRRSSLSDLLALQSSPAVAMSPAQLRMPITPTRPVSQRSEAKRSEIPSPTKTTPILANVKSPEAPSTTRSIKPSLTSSSTTTRTGSPTRIGSPSRSVAPARKENIPPPRNTLTERAVNRKSDEAVFSPTSADKRTKVSTYIPTPKSGRLPERPPQVNSTTTSPVKRTPSSSPQKLQKLRIQSPQKLRERLNNDKKALATAESGFQAELSKIGEELSALKLNPTSSTAALSRSPSVASTTNLAHRLTTLQAQLSAFTADLTARHATLESDLSTTLGASERKVKKLDELYRDAGRENEALYERFNEELSKAMKSVRASGDNGVGELKSRLKEAGKEAEGLRRENWRLKREVLGLKAVVQGKESGGEVE